MKKIILSVLYAYTSLINSAAQCPAVPYKARQTNNEFTYAVMQEQKASHLYIIDQANQLFGVTMNNNGYYTKATIAKRIKNNIIIFNGESSRKAMGNSRALLIRDNKIIQSSTDNKTDMYQWGIQKNDILVLGADVLADKDLQHLLDKALETNIKKQHALNPNSVQFVAPIAYRIGPFRKEPRNHTVLVVQFHK